MEEILSYTCNQEYIAHTFDVTKHLLVIAQIIVAVDVDGAAAENDMSMAHTISAFVNTSPASNRVSLRLPSGRYLDALSPCVCVIRGRTDIMLKCLIE